VKTFDKVLDTRMGIEQDLPEVTTNDACQSAWVTTRKSQRQMYGSRCLVRWWVICCREYT